LDGGISATTSLLSTTWRRTLCVSTTGVSPVTVTVSVTAPARISALMVKTPSPVISIPSCFTALNLVNVNVAA
jgi:hypothetical protein